MKWIGAFVIGLLLGVVAAAAVIYFNPFTDQRHADLSATSQLRYELGPDTLSFTHGEQLGLDLQPRDVAALWEAPIRRSMLGAFVLEDRQGNAVGIASRAIKLSQQHNVLLSGMIVADHWLVTIAGAGSYFVESRDNIWPLLRDTFIDVNLLSREWTGPQHYELSVGPAPGAVAAVTGMSGRFAGVAGEAVHAVDVDSYKGRSQLLSPVRGQLLLDIRAAEPAQVAETP